MKRLISIMLATAIMFTAYLGKANADNYEKDYWGLAFGPGMPSYATDYNDVLHVNYYYGGHVAKATSLSGSTDRKIKITTYSPVAFSTGNNYREITVSGVVTPSWNVVGSTGLINYFVEAIGSSNCASNGFICLNVSALYNA